MSEDASEHYRRSSRHMTFIRRLSRVYVCIRLCVFCFVSFCFSCAAMLDRVLSGPTSKAPFSGWKNAVQWRCGRTSGRSGLSPEVTVNTRSASWQLRQYDVQGHWLMSVAGVVGGRRSRWCIRVDSLTCCCQLLDFVLFFFFFLCVFVFLCPCVIFFSCFYVLVFFFFRVFVFFVFLFC